MEKRFLWTSLVLISLVPLVSSSFRDNRSSGHEVRDEAGHESTSDPAVEVVKWNWHHVGLILTITIFIVLSGLAKVGKNNSFNLLESSH